MTNAELMRRNVKDFTKNMHRCIKSMEAIVDTVSQVKKHSETDHELAKAESIRLHLVDVGDALQRAYDITLANLQL